MAGNFSPIVGDQAINSKQRIDYVSATRVLYGFAAPGTDEASPGWQIRQQTLDAQGRTTHIDFAGGTLARNQVWTSRMSLDYS